MWGFTDSPAPRSARVWAKIEAGQGFLDTSTEPSRRMEMSYSIMYPETRGKRPVLETDGETWPMPE